MITLIALAIAFLTLLTPSPSSGQPTAVAPELRGKAAIWADELDPFAPLLGDWVATVTLPEGDTEVALMTISRSGDESATISMGHGSERFTGPLAAHFDGKDVVFASAATSQVAELGPAMIAGRLASGACPTGTAYLPSMQRLITWTTRAAHPPSR